MSVRLRAPQHRVEKRAIALWALQSLLFGLGLLAVAGAVYRFWEAARPVVLAAVVLIAVRLLIGVIVEPLWRYRVHRWETTEQVVYARTGWLVQQWRAAPLSRVQTVDATRGPLEQLLGLSTLKVTTASSSGAIEIAGMNHQVAARVAEELAEIAELTPGDAT